MGKRGHSTRSEPLKSEESSGPFKRSRPPSLRDEPPLSHSVPAPVVKKSPTIHKVSLAPAPTSREDFLIKKPPQEEETVDVPIKAPSTKETLTREQLAKINAAYPGVKGTPKRILTNEVAALPVMQLASKIAESVRHHAVTLVAGETGSGKSTQLPQILVDSGLLAPGFALVCTQPRRVAAVTLAQRVAWERAGPSSVATVAGRRKKNRSIYKDAASIAKQANKEAISPAAVVDLTLDEATNFVGEEVGYSIRFEDRTGPNTRIKYATDGVLLREAATDPLLSKYSVVVLDEAHERSLQTDLLMGLLRQALARRSDLRLVVMSATLQIETFTNFFSGITIPTAPTPKSELGVASTEVSVIQVPGRQFPVDVRYTVDAEADYVDAALLTCLQIHEEEPAGGVLIFLPGQEDIESLQTLLTAHLPTTTAHKDLRIARATHLKAVRAEAAAARAEAIARGEDPTASTHVEAVKVTNEINTVEDMQKLAVTTTSTTATAPPVDVGIENLRQFEIRPLYASMPPDEQLAVFFPAPPGVRVFILATNIAETSLTISGVKYVVDSGLVKTRTVNNTSGMELLRVVPVSQSQANQRAGRAGRESAGMCFRIYTESTFEGLAVASVPEILRMDLSQAILHLKSIGIPNPATFPYVSPPSPVALKAALIKLLLLGALDKDQQLTKHGRNMAALPLTPVYSHLLLKSAEFGCVSEILTAVAMLSAENVFLSPHQEEAKRAAFQAQRAFSSPDGDFVTLVNVYQAWQKARKDRGWTSKHFLSHRALSLAENVRQQLSTLLQKLGISSDSTRWPDRTPFLQCILAGLSNNVAQRTNVVVQDAPVTAQTASQSAAKAFEKKFSFTRNVVAHTRNGTLSESNAPYRTMRSRQPVHIHPSSVLFSLHQKKLPDYLVYAEVLTTSKDYMRTVSVVQAEWVTALSPATSINPATSSN